MIKIVIKKENDKLSSLEFNGHADYEDYGKDIVCASASSILTTTVNAIIRINEDAIDVKYGKDVVNVTINKHDDVIDLLLDNMLDLLTELQNQYKKNVKIIL